MSDSVEYNPLNHSIVQACMKADAWQQFEVSDFVEALVVALKSELERVYWNFHQETLDQADWQLTDVGDGFEYRRYFWGDCDCGFDERWEAKDEEWCRINIHQPDCYQTELRNAEAEYDERSGYTKIHEAAFGINPSSFQMLFGQEPEISTDGVVTTITSQPHNDAHERWCQAHNEKREWMGALYERLMEKYNKPRHGCAVHCTCDYEQKRAEWCETDDHADTCSPQLPNLRYKGVEINWYKYIGRGMSVNVDWDEKRWREWFDDAMKTIRLYDTCHEYSHEKAEDIAAGREPFSTHRRVQRKNCSGCMTDLTL